MILAGLFLVVWLFGLIEQWSFINHLRRTNPTLAKEHFPGWLKSSPHQQVTSSIWLWKRKYINDIDSESLKRADIHRITSISTLAMILLLAVAMVVTSLRIEPEPNSVKSTETSSVTMNITRSAML